MSIDLSKAPLEKRTTYSDAPIQVGRTVSVLVSGNVLGRILTRLAREAAFFAVKPSRGSLFTITCAAHRAENLLEIIRQVEKHK